VKRIRFIGSKEWFHDAKIGCFAQRFRTPITVRHTIITERRHFQAGEDGLHAKPVLRAQAQNRIKNGSAGDCP